jgi:hypothetical protein
VSYPRRPGQPGLALRLLRTERVTRPRQDCPLPTKAFLLVMTSDMLLAMPSDVLLVTRMSSKFCWR